MSNSQYQNMNESTGNAMRFDAAQVDRALRAYRPVGGWIERPADMQPQLEGDVRADVVVVGGGFAGLSTA